MAISVRILGWKAEGLRCPDHEFQFRQPSADRPCVTLLQMPNGTGKTTTLELLRACLSGDAERTPWSAERILSYKKKNSKANHGLFQVQIQYAERRYTFAMNFLFDEGRIAYSTTLPSGQDEGFCPPKELHQNFLNPDFINFFVFDGELAHRLLSEKYTNAQVAIEGLFHLRLFDTLRPMLNLFWQRAVEGKTAKDDKGLVRRRNRVADLKVLLEKRRTEQATLLAEDEKISATITDLRRKYNKELAKKDTDTKRLTAANDRFRQVEAKLDSTGQASLNYMRNPLGFSHHFAQALYDFKGSLDRAKLPESVAKEFFTDVAESGTCICGRPLDAAARAELSRRAQQYFGTEDVALLMSMKSDIAQFVGGAPNGCEHALDELLNQLVSASNELLEAKTAKEAIEAELVHSDPNLEKVKKEIDGLEERQKEIRTELDKYESPDNAPGDERVFGIKILERRLRDAEVKLAEITETRELKSKIDKLERIFSDALQIARTRLGQRIRDETNEIVRRVMPNNQIRVSSIDTCLRLEGQSAGSVGETLSVGYAFLKALFAQGGHELPFIVDSPANPIDLATRRRVAALVPELTRQFLAFTISPERQAFLDALEAAMGDRIQYITMFRNFDAKLTDSAKGFSGARQTLDGVIVENKEFFKSFHLEEEGESPSASK